MQDLRVTTLIWEAAEDDRLEVDHRLPVSFEIAAVPQPGLTPEQSRETVPVNVSVFLVPHEATDPVAQRCAVGGDVVLVERGGDPGPFETNLTVPARCLRGGAVTEFDLMVELAEDTGSDSVRGVTRTLHFTTANVMNASRAESACRLDEGDERCDVPFDVEPKSGNENFTHTVRPQSNVGVLWASPATTEGTQMEVAPPNLSLEVATRAYGNDPESADDDTLPGPVGLTVELAPARGNFARQFVHVPFSMRPVPDAEEGAPAVRAFNGGVEDQSYAHVYLPEALQARMVSGDWAGNDLYLVRVCERPEGWEEDAEPSDESREFLGTAETDGDPACRIHTVRFARTLAPTQSRLERLYWDRRFEKGNDRLRGVASFGVQGDISATGARFLASPSVGLRLFGQNINILSMAADANGILASPRDSGFFFNISAFNQNLLNVSRTLGGDARVRVESPAVGVMRQACAKQNFVIVVVPVEVEACLRGEVGVRGHAELAAGTTNPPGEFAGATAWATASGGITPEARIGVDVRGGIGGRIAGFGVEVNLNVVTLSLPATATVTAAISAPPGVSPPMRPAILDQNCRQWAPSNGWRVEQCGWSTLPGPNWFRPTQADVAFNNAFAMAFGQYQPQLEAYQRMLRPRGSGNVNVSLGLEFLSGRFGIYGYVGPIRGSITIGSWDGIPGLGGGRSSVPLYDRRTGVINLF